MLLVVSGVGSPVCRWSGDGVLPVSVVVSLGWVGSFSVFWGWRWAPGGMLVTVSDEGRLVWGRCPGRWEGVVVGG